MREPREPRLTRPASQQGQGREPAFGRPARPGRQEPDLFDLFPGRNDPQPGWDTDAYGQGAPAGHPATHGAGNRAVPPPYGSDPSADGYGNASFGADFGASATVGAADMPYPDPFGRDPRHMQAPQAAVQPPPFGATPPPSARTTPRAPVADPYGLAADPRDPFHPGPLTTDPSPLGWSDPDWDPPPSSDFSGRGPVAAAADPRREPMMAPAPEHSFRQPRTPDQYAAAGFQGDATAEPESDFWADKPVPPPQAPTGRRGAEPERYAPEPDRYAIPEPDRYAVEPEEGFFAKAPRRETPQEPSLRDPAYDEAPQRPAPVREPPPRRDLRGEGPPPMGAGEDRGGLLGSLRLKRDEARPPRMASPFPITGLPETAQRRSKTMLWVAVAAGVLLVGGAGWMLFNGRNGADGKLGAPTIMADPSPYKVRPADPGGMQVANQDKMVYERISPEEAQQPGVEKLLPEPTAPRAPEVSEPQRPTQAVIPAGPQAMETAAASVPPQPQGAPSGASGGASGGAVPVGQVAAPPMVPSPPAPVSTGPAPSFNMAQPGAPEAASPPPARGPAVLGPPVTGPASTAPQQPTATAAITPPAAAVPPPARTAATGSFSVQLAALRDEVSVRKQWDGLKAKYPDLLGSYSMGIEKADLGEKGVFYRLRATGLPTEESARTLCNELAKQKVGCLFVGK